MANIDVPNTGNAVTNGTNFAAALVAAVLGDTITLHPGAAAYQGNFTLSAKGAGSSFITIQSSSLSSLPAGVRVSPSSITNMPLVTTPNGSPAFTCAADSHHWKLAGLAVTTANSFPSGQRTPSLITRVDGITYNHWPRDITIERCLIYASETDPTPYRSAECGIFIDGENITYTDNYIYNFMGWEYPSVLYAVSAATNSNPVQVTFASSISNPGHKFLVYLTGGTGAWAALNGTKVATWVSGTQVTLEDYNEVTFALTNINSTSFGSFSGQSVNRLSQSIATSRAILIIAGPGPYTIENNFGEAYYTPIFTGGGGTWIPPANQVTVSSVNSLTQVVLSGVGNLAVGDLIAFSATQDQTISGATAGTTTIITTQPHTYPAGTIMVPEGCVTISGFTGSWAPLNGAWGSNGNGCGSGTVTVIDSTHIRIPLDSSGFGAVTSGSPKWVLTTKNNSGPKQWVVGKVTNISGNTVTYQWWGHQPENTNGNGAGILIAAGAIAQFNGLNLHGLTIQRNTFSVKRHWIWLFRDNAKTGNNNGQPPKALWEAKTADDVVFNGNVAQIEGGSLAPNDGTVCLGLNQANQDGSTPWVSLNNWQVTNNLFNNYPFHKISMREEYESGEVGSGFVFTNNLLTPNEASFIHLEGTDTVTIEHNTVRNFGDAGGGAGGSNAFLFLFNVNTNTIVRNNIGNWLLYGYVALDPWTPLVRTHNYLIDNDNQGFTPPAGCVRVATVAAMGFVDVVAGDSGANYHGYELTSGSVGHNAATDGTDVGVNFALLDAALGGNNQRVVMSGQIVISGQVVVS